MEGIQCFPIAAVLLYLVIFSKLNLGASKSSGFKLRLIPRDSPESPSYPGNLTQSERIKRLVQFSNAKVELRKLHYSTMNATFDDRKYLIALRRQLHYYFGEFKIGTPRQIVHLMIDTGSDLTWTQCQPCINCFYQATPIYDSRLSSTYRRVGCDHPLCNYRDPWSHFQCVNGLCVYGISYGSGNIGPAKGFASFEVFRFLTDTDGHTAKFSIFFGCSVDNTNFVTFNDPPHMMSGILGLDLSPMSVFGQLSEFIGAVFSYCMVPYDENFPFLTRALLLRFGDHVYIPQRNIPTTHYYSFPGQNSYYLLCSDISVGVYRLGLPAGTFDVGPTSGFFLDTGAPFTIITTQAINGINVFQIVMTTFRSYFGPYNLQPVPQGYRPPEFELCYYNRAGFTNFPSMTFHFQGADYVVDARYMYVSYERFFCVALMGAPVETILGAYQMQNMRIIHNGHIESIQFYPDNCAQDYL